MTAVSELVCRAEGFSLDMRDIEVAARAIAATEAARLGRFIPTYVEANWPRWAEAAKAVVADLDAERVRRALFAGGSLAQALVTAEAMAADACAYRDVLTP